MLTINEKVTGKNYTLKQLKQFRQEATKYIDIHRLQAVNHLIVKYAKKYKLDYYSL